SREFACMADSKVCPSADALADYRAGRLDDTAASTVEVHLAACEACQQQFEQSPEPLLVQRLRQAVAKAPADAEPPNPVRDSPTLADTPALFDDHPRFRALQFLDQGGMGCVYQARQLNPARDVAVKVLTLGPAATPDLIERFRREALTGGLD